MIVLDLETTGFDPLNDKIIEIAIIKVDNNGQILDTFHHFVNPEKEIPLNISNLTGISNEQVVDKPTFEQLKPEVINFLDDQTELIIGHNIGFDINFLINNDIKIANPLVDTHILSQIAWPTLPSFALENLSNYFEIKHFPAHSALADIKANNDLWQKIKEQLQNISSAQQEQIINILTKVDSSLQSFTEERSYLNPFFKQ